MITIDTINNIYNKYNALNADADVCTERNLHRLMMFAFDSDHMDFDGDRLTFTRGAGPLKSIEIERIAGAEDLGSHMAIVMPASVIFVDKKTGEVKVFLAE
ncbi:MAG: hypothetical protein K2L33_01835 [Muribaculaceae bacterium]|nr:hypothetical protein [Muribaculaceae bacterium]MDE6366301.1 hypothetical protein [Muribaculaceae bacterium]